VRLGIGMEGHAVGGQALQMANGLRHSLAAEPIKGPCMDGARGARGI
jgi:hypothetical protein